MAEYDIYLNDHGTPVKPKIDGRVSYLEGRVIDVKLFGAKGDGVTDDTAAIQAALDAAKNAGGGTVYLPTGNYRKANTSATLRVYSNTTLCGSGDASVILAEDLSSVPRCDLMILSDTENVTLRDFRVVGTLESNLSNENANQTITGSRVRNLRVLNVTIEKVRYMAIACSQVKDAYFSGCVLRDVVADGIRCTQSQNVKVEGCSFYRVADDCVALHSRDDAPEAVLADAFVVTGNTMEASQGVKVLGAKNLIVSNNVFRRMLRSPLYIENDWPNGPEGNTAMFSIMVTNNIIMDTFGDRGTNYVINIKSKGMVGNGTTLPGSNASPFEYNYTNGTQEAGSVTVPTAAVQIKDNIIGWTLPRGVKYSSYGYGLLFDRFNTNLPESGYFDPDITDASFRCKGIMLGCPVRMLDISGNQFFGGPAGSALPAIQLYVAKNGGITLESAIISKNTFNDWPASYCVHLQMTSDATSANFVRVMDNEFNLDPFFRHPNHNSDNTWSDILCKAIYAQGNFFLCEFERNTIKNAGDIHQGNAINTHDNTVYFAPAEGTTGLDNIAGNRGVRRVTFSPRYNHVIIQGDPTKPNFGSIKNIPLRVSTSMPTSGHYVYGDFVENVSIASTTTQGISVQLVGWRRLTTGEAHVLNQDWKKEYAIL